MEKTIQDYFDFFGLLKTVRLNTIECFNTAEEYIEDTCVEDEEEIKSLKLLYKLIKDEKWLEEIDLEVSEDQFIDFNADIIEISFDEDTSTHNEGGSHYGGYQYVFTIDTEMMMFKGLEVINHN